MGLGVCWDVSIRVVPLERRMCAVFLWVAIFDNFLARPNVMHAEQPPTPVRLARQVKEFDS
jgi:hypothetical protein